METLAWISEEEDRGLPLTLKRKKKHYTNTVTCTPEGSRRWDQYWRTWRRKTKA